MNQNLTDITVILDRSGSMAGRASDVIGGFNKLLADQRNTPGQATISLNQFDDIFENRVTAADISLVANLNTATYVPRGGTALLDAIGRTVKETGRRLHAMAEQDRPGKVVVVIISDGLENASRVYRRAQISSMLDHQRSKYKWEFVFMGTNQDAIAEAGQLGISQANALTYAGNTQGVLDAFDSISSNLRSYRKGLVSTMAYQAQDYAAQAQAGATGAQGVKQGVVLPEEPKP